MNIFKESYLKKSLKEKFCVVETQSEIEIFMKKFTEDPQKEATVLLCMDAAERLTYKAPFIRFLYIWKGSVEMKLDGKILTYSAGCLVVASPYTEVIYKQIAEDTRVLTILLKEEFFSDLYNAQFVEFPMFFDFFTSILYMPEQKSTYFLFECDPKDDSYYHVLILVKQIIQMNGKYENACRAALLLLLSELDRVKRDCLRLKDSTVLLTSIVSEMINYMKKHYQFVNLNTLGDIFHFHPNYISKLIKEQTGISFSQHLSIIRLEQAKHCLLQTDWSIQRISEHIGYTEKSYFIKLFKKHYGCPPSRFRKRRFES